MNGNIKSSVALSISLSYSAQGQHFRVLLLKPGRTLCPEPRSGFGYTGDRCFHMVCCCLEHKIKDLSISSTHLHGALAHVPIDRKQSKESGQEHQKMNDCSDADCYRIYFSKPCRRPL